MNASLPDAGFSPDALSTALADIPGVSPHSCFAVAFSGGADSTALLLALNKVIGGLSGIGRLRALHFDHAIHPESDHWRQHCLAVCSQHKIVFQSKRHKGKPLLNESAAREARYQWLTEALAPGEVLLTGHHLDDQVETVVMTLCQGRGLHRIAGIPETRALTRNTTGEHSPIVARPMLQFSRYVLEDWLSGQQVKWIEDPSNYDASIDRNFIRHQVLPLLKSRWSATNANICRAAHQIFRLSVSASTEIARLTTAITDPQARRLFCQAAPLRRSALATLEDDYRVAVLRYWVSSLSVPAPADKQLREFSGQISSLKADSLAGTEWGRFQIRGWKDHLYLLPILPLQNTLVQTAGAAVQFGDLTILMEAAVIGGMSMSALSQAHAKWRMRQGGERFLLSGREHHSRLKKLLQSANVPPWERKYVPLLEVDGEIAWVYGIGVSKNFVAGKEDFEGVLPSISFTIKP